MIHTSLIIALSLSSALDVDRKWSAEEAQEFVESNKELVAAASFVLSTKHLAQQCPEAFPDIDREQAEAARAKARGYHEALLERFPAGSPRDFFFEMETMVAKRMDGKISSGEIGSEKCHAIVRGISTAEPPEDVRPFLESRDVRRP